MRPLLWSLVLIFTPSLLAGCANAPSDESPIPIWWSPLLELEGLDAIEERLDRELPGDDFYRFTPPDSQTGETAFVRSCRDALRVMPGPIPADFDAGSPLNPEAAVKFFYHCDLLTRLKTAIPSKASHLPPLAPDLSLFERLPAFTGGFVNDLTFCTTARISEAGLSWGDLIAMDHLQPDWNGWLRHEDLESLVEAYLARPHRWSRLTQELVGSLEIKFYRSERDPATGRYHRFGLKVQGVNYALYPLARADFDHDGSEDMALAVFWKVSGVSYYSHLQLFTRTRPESPMSVINFPEINRQIFDEETCE